MVAAALLLVAAARWSDRRQPQCTSSAVCKPDSPQALSANATHLCSVEPNLARFPAVPSSRGDARFYQHHGFDWHQIQIAAEDDMEGGRSRGASTITQQLVKNLLFGTGRSVLRKGAEFTLVPVAEFVLGKQRNSGALPHVV